MKDRLNVTIDPKLLDGAKRYAARNNTSLSMLIEGYLRTLTAKKARKKNILDLVKELPKPKGSVEKYSGKVYLEENKSKYGF